VGGAEPPDPHMGSRYRARQGAPTLKPWLRHWIREIDPTFILKNHIPQTLLGLFGDSSCGLRYVASNHITWYTICAPRGRGVSCARARGNESNRQLNRKGRTQPQVRSG
jgi:hypothetical protein